MIRDQEVYNRIGRILVKMLPETWEKVIFSLKIDEDKQRWNGECFFLNDDNITYGQVTIELTPNLLSELLSMRNNGLFPKFNSDLVFYRNGTYEIIIDKTMFEKKSPSLNTIQDAIQNIKSINMETADIDEFKNDLGTLLLGYTLSTPIIQKETTLYRGVKWGDKPHNVSELTYPPEKYIKNLHRAGRPRRSLFYCSTAREAPFFELGVVKGDNVAISHWKVQAQLIVNNVGYHDAVFSNLGSVRECPSWNKTEEPHDFDQTNSTVRHLFATEFAKIVPQGQEHLYKMSIAIAELHFSQEMFAGLIYPSIAMRANSDNLVLKPECVDNYIKLHKVEYIQINESSGYEFDVKILDFADTFGPDGKIQWKGRPPQWFLREKGQLLHFSVENGRWVARNDKGETVELE